MPPTTERVDSVADSVQLQYTGVRVVVSGLPSRRAVAVNQRSAIADLFDAESTSLSTSSLLWDKKEPAVKELRSALLSAVRVFKDRTMTLPSTVPGVRLVRKDCISQFDQRMAEQRAQISVAAERLREVLPEIVSRARTRRGNLFREEDYYFDPREACTLSWSFVTIAANTELLQIDDAIYQREVERTREELRQIVQHAEAQLADDLLGALQHAAERLGTDATGAAYRFRASTVTKLFDELSHLQQQFRQTGIGGGTVLQEAANSLKALLGSETPTTLPDSLRNSDRYREEFKQKCADLAEQVQNSLQLLPRRRLILEPPNA